MSWKWQDFISNVEEKSVTMMPSFIMPVLCSILYGACNAKNYAGIFDVLEYDIRWLIQL